MSSCLAPSSMYMYIGTRLIYMNPWLISMSSWLVLLFLLLEFIAHLSVYRVLCCRALLNVYRAFWGVYKAHWQGSFECIHGSCDVFSSSFSLSPAPRKRSPFRCVTCLIDTCDIMHSCACAMTYVCVWHGVFTCVAWPVHLCDTPHADMWHDALYMSNELICMNHELLFMSHELMHKSHELSIRVCGEQQRVTMCWLWTQVYESRTHVYESQTHVYESS